MTTAGFLSTCRRILAFGIFPLSKDEEVVEDEWTDLGWSPSPSDTPSPSPSPSDTPSPSLPSNQTDDDEDTLIRLFHSPGPFFSFSEKVVEVTRRNAKRSARRRKG